VIVGGTDGLGKWSALNESLPGRIFISYRRQETAWPARQLYDVLVERFPAEQVFKDIDSIEPGEDFIERTTAAVASCDVLLALIGPQWLTMTDKDGHRRLDDPEDYVRVEIETALTRKIRVIPILVDHAKMPGAKELPATLAPLVRRNAVEINPETFDTKRLISTVQKTLAALKISDTAAGWAPPLSTSRPDRLNRQVAGPEVDQLYDQALGAFWTEQWDKAVDLLGQVLSRQPDYADAARKLEAARQKKQLASHYAQASAAADAGNWEQAVAAYTMITDADPDYRDTNARLAEARHQQQLVSLLAEAHRLHRAGQWAAVIKVGEQLQALDPDAADPDGLITSAGTELVAEEPAVKLAADYYAALHLFEARRWEEAIKALEQVIRLDSGYQDAPALLNRARREVEQAAAPVEEQSRRQADEADRVAPAQKSARLPHRPLEIITVDDAEPSKQLQSPPQKSRTRGRWIILVTLAGVLVLATIIAVVNGYQSNKNPTPISTAKNPTPISTAPAGTPSSTCARFCTEDYDKLLSHLPGAEKSTCQSSISDGLAQALCHGSGGILGIYDLWENAGDASKSVTDTDMHKGECLRAPPDENGAYQYWSKNGMSGILTCDHYGKIYWVKWSIDELGMTGQFRGDSVEYYQEVVSEALRIRDGVK
jgi:tetratricopeptide (TPR) repeat protein